MIRTVNSYILTLTSFLSLLAFGCADIEQEPDFHPEVLDNRLHLELIEASPNVMTPIGLAIDSSDEVYVLESHTHSPPSNYKGPAFDRIKKGVDQNKDGKPESWIIFADSINDGMNLAAGPDHIIYLTEKDRVLSFQDIDQDGISDQVKTILKMETFGHVYEHAGILGIALSPDGWLYISRGNTGSLAWQIEGSDGSILQGYGDGGNVFRCQPDGSSLEEVATGFWNPFDLKFTHAGRLLLVDNDPDSRGPNRLLEVVPGGDYGYQSFYGGSGIHPFLAWNGELPGTLPYAAALGEAPSGLIDASFTNFPADYVGNILCTIWEENTIVRVPLQPHLSSVKGQAEVLVKGDSTFHPVALATNSKGEVYITDWVVRQYPNHGEGRIWRLTSGKSQPMQKKEVVYASLPQEENSFFSLYANLSSLDQHLKALQSGDIFVQAVARKSLRKPAYHQDLLALGDDTDPAMRLQALLTLTASSMEVSEAKLKDFLQDENEDIRRMALIYIATHLREDLLPTVKQALHSRHITPSLFETYLATIRHLQPDFIRNYRAKSESEAKKIERKLPPSYLMSIISDSSLPDETRAAALPYLEKLNDHIPALVALLKSASRPIQASLLQALKQTPHEQVAEAMLEIALDHNAENALRTQALVALGYQPSDHCKEVQSLLQQENEVLLETALRYLCRCSGDENTVAAVNPFIEQTHHKNADQLRQIWQLCLNKIPLENRPQSDEQWAQVVDDSGSAEKGKVVFQLANTQCQHCHQVAGWGGNFGPDLSHVGSSKSREQLITAILEPSAEISPEWQGWYVIDQEGKTHYGRQIDVGLDAVELLMPSGSFVTFDEPQSYGLAPSSLMPEGLENTLTESEFNHLIAYLMSLQ